jgi:GT2 family glycosyltransferase
MSQTPELSVIIASYNARATIGRCLASLRAQSAAGAFEVIVADSSTDGTADLIAAEFPEVQVLRSATRMFPGGARNLALRHARGALVTFLDADCAVDPSWAEQILRIDRADSPAVGGAIANAVPSNLPAWAAYFCEFSQWMPGSRARWMTDIAGASMSYPRSVFDENGEFIEGVYCSDTEFHWRLARRGIRLKWDPSILVTHSSIASLSRLLRHEFHHGRYFARMRLRAGMLSRPLALLMACAGPLIAAKLFAAIVLRNLRNPIYLGRFLASSPLTALGVAAWTAGECAGYLRPL